MKKQDAKVINLRDFASENAIPKSHLQTLVRHIAREVNRHKISYDQLKFVFRSVRERCDLAVPNQSGRKLYELPSGEELTAFFAAIKNPVHRLIFEVLEGTGVRVDELCSLEVRRIDFERNLVFVHEGKGKKDRVTVIGCKLVEKIRLYLQDRKNKYLFESNRHTRYSTRRVEQLCEQYREAAGITKRFTPHTLRHVWNTRLAEAGVPKEKRKILAGHNSDRAQDIYTHLAAGGIKDDVLAVLDQISR